MNNYLRFALFLAIVYLLNSLSINVCSANETETSVIRLYLDADFSNSTSSSNAIKNGILTALYEVNYEISGHPVELVTLDHHGNTRRSKVNLLKYDEDSDALAIYCGLHSSPVLVNLDLIQNNEILLLDPWAAAGPITRRTDKTGKNWIFRLSIDDTKAGEVLVRYAIDQEKYEKPALLLENTGWGKSNQKTISSAILKRNIEPISIIYFDWKLGKVGASEIISDIYQSGADVVFLVSNAPEGKTIITAMSERNSEERLPIRSHWGITGGDFFNFLGENIIIDQIDLKFLQTSFSFIDTSIQKHAHKIFRNLMKIDPSIKAFEDLKAPVGFIHAYDLTKLLIAAIESVEWEGKSIQNRSKVRDALENILAPVKGLIKTYKQPFGKFSEQNQDAHEALSENDMKMAKYLRSGAIKLINSKGSQ